MDRSKLAQPVNKPKVKKYPTSMRWRAGLPERIKKHAELLSRDRGENVPFNRLVNDIVEGTLDQWDKEIGVNTKE